MKDYQAPSDLLAGRVILVTGAGDGIGRAAALAYARHGATVVLLGRTVRKLEQVYDEIQAAGGAEPAITPLDLSKATLPQYDEIAGAIASEFGRLDGLLHNAADLGTLTPLELYDLEVWSRTLQVNLHAPFLLTRACLDLLKKSADASVVFTSADVGRHSRAYWGAYAVSQFAIEGLMQTWAAELRDTTPIRMNSLNPGAVQTHMRRRAYPGENPSQLKKPEEIMAAYLYLMGPDSRGATGQAFDAQ
jgi:NAD(P)-dependent dehydrogenase (short-subunit alcohol dehydrogenase family)